MTKPGELFQGEFAGMSITTDVESTFDKDSNIWTCVGKVRLGRTKDSVEWEYGEQSVKCMDNSFQKSYMTVGNALQRIVAESDDKFFNQKAE